MKTGKKRLQTQRELNMKRTKVNEENFFKKKETKERKETEAKRRGELAQADGAVTLTPHTSGACDTLMYYRWG